MVDRDSKQAEVGSIDPDHPFVWSSRFSVGHAELDSQHRHLMKVVNRLRVLSKQVAPSETHYDHLMEEIGEYLRLHLLYEERLMGSVNFPQLRQHRDLHAQIMIKMAAYLAKGKVRQLPEVVAFMQEWLLQHILLEDMKLKPYL